MKTLLQAQARESLQSRLAALRPDSPGRWGRFTAGRMLAHVIQSLEMMTGDLPMAASPTPWVLRNPPLKQLLIYVLPFPKGLPTSPELLSRAGADAAGTDAVVWAAELRAFDEALARVPIVAASGRWPAHPAFGPLSGDAWAVLQYRHLDHHFRQFGV